MVLVQTRLPKVLLLCESYLGHATILGSTLQSFVTWLGEASERVTLFHHNSFHREADRLARLAETLQDAEPDIILSINATGFNEILVAYIEKHKPYVSTWYWDHPNMMPKEATLLAAQYSKIFSACKDFSDSTPETAFSFLPFSSTPALPHQQTPDRNIAFLGTLWHVYRVFQYASVGLTCLQNQQHYFGLELYHALQAPELSSAKWKTTAGQIINPNDLLNAFAGLKRVKTLTWLKEFGLHIYGQHDWLFHLWPIAPELLPLIEYRSVSNNSQMRELLSQHKISLNIFHTQNKHGGSNFRILDSAVHGCAILSDYNRGCAEMFPAEEAALYFTGPADAEHHTHRLLNDKALNQKLVRNAAAIVNDAHTHQHRIDLFFKEAGFSGSHAANRMLLPAETRDLNVSNIQLVSASLAPHALDPDFIPCKLTKIPDPRASGYFKTENYYVEMCLATNEIQIQYLHQQKQWKLAQPMLLRYQRYQWLLGTIEWVETSLFKVKRALLKPFKRVKPNLVKS